MSQVNFVEQFNLFMDYSRRNKLTSYERIFYLGLFHCANDLARQTENFEWPDDYFPVSNVELNGWTGFDERAIRNTRNSLKQRGLLDFQKGDGRRSDPVYRIYYLRKIGYKIAPDLPAQEMTGRKKADGQGIDSENAAERKECEQSGTKTQPIEEISAAKTQPVNEQSEAKMQPITQKQEPITCEFAPDHVGDPVGDPVGDGVGDPVVIDCENAGEHFIKNKLNVNVNTNANIPPLPEGEPKEERGAPVEAEPLDNPELGRVMSFYMDHFTSYPSPMAIAGLEDFTESLGADVVIHAMDIAASEGKVSWSYIRGILNRYQREGLRSMADVQLSEQRFEESKARRSREKSQEPERPQGGGLVDLNAPYGGTKGLVSGFNGRW